MGKTILFNNDYINGVGDTFASLYKLINCAACIRCLYPEYKLIYLVNSPRNSLSLQYITNFNFLNSLFDEFKVLSYFQQFTVRDNIGNYNGYNFKRLVTDKEPDINPGAYVYVPLDDYNSYQNLNIPFEMFKFQGIDIKPKNFEIIKPDILNNAKAFVQSNFPNGFEAIHFRSDLLVDEKKTFKFRDEVIPYLDKSKSYFMCSNSGFAKRTLLETGFDIKFFKPLSTHDDVRRMYGGHESEIQSAIECVTEMVILGESSHLYQLSAFSWLSLFTWYAVNVKKVPLTRFY